MVESEEVERRSWRRWPVAEKLLTTGVSGKASHSAHATHRGPCHPRYLPDATPVLPRPCIEAHPASGSIIVDMALNDILDLIDAEIDRLQQAKAVLSAVSAPTAPEPVTTPAKGRPKKVAQAVPATAPTKKKRNLSPEGRARIAEAVKRRWAAQKA